MTKKEFIYFLLILLVLLIFGLVATIEATTIDFESLDNLIEGGECVWGEIPEMKFSLYHCKEENISYCSLCDGYVMEQGFGIANMLKL